MNRNLARHVLSSFVLLFVLFLPICALAGTKEKIRVGYVEGYGTIMDDVSADKIGYGYEYLKKISAYTEWEYEFVPVLWSEGLEMLENGELDLFGPMEKSPARLERFEFGQGEIGYEYGCLYALSESEIFYNDYEGFDGLKVGVAENTYFYESFKSFCEEKGFNVTFVFTNSNDIGGELSQNKYDVFLCGSLLEIDNTKVVCKFAVEPFYYAAPKGRTDIAAALDYAIAEINNESIYYASDLNKKYFSDKPISKITFTKEDLEIIKNLPPLNVGYELGFAPLQYLDDATNLPKGISIEILELIKNETGLQFNYIPLEKGFETLPKNIDLLVGYQKNRFSDSLFLSDSYLNVPTVFVAHKEKMISPQSALKIGVSPVDSVSGASLLVKYKDASVTEYKSTADALKALSVQDEDLVLTSIYAFNEIARANNADKYIVFSANMDFPISIGISRGLPSDVERILNKAIHRLNDQEISTIVFANTLNRAYDLTFSQYLRENANGVLLVSGIIVVILSALIIIIVTSNKNSKAALSKAAYVDDITGLATMLKFKEEAHRLLSQAAPNEYTITAIDIDNFKFINDIYGFESGNRLLNIIGNGLMNVLFKDAVVARQAADNFIILHKTEDRITGHTEHRLNDILLNASEVIGQNYRINFSCGSFIVSDSSIGLSAMMDNANIAKKTVKNIYGHAFALFTQQMHAEIITQREITFSMEIALIKNEFALYLQPKISLEGGEICGAEALVRWISPEKGMIAPMDFIPLFEKNGFIQKLDLYMFNKTCAITRQMKESNDLEAVRISVNLSKITLMKPNLVAILLDSLKSHGLRPNDIEIELTEGVLLDDIANGMATMRSLKDAGFYISIDDFGSGYSSLSLLKDLPANALKIDKGFLSDTIHSRNGREIIKSIILMSKNLDLETIAEGVETLEQANNLHEMGCDIAQGFYFFRPMPAIDFTGLIKSKLN